MSKLPVGAAELLRYFENAARQHPDPHWTRGAEMCRDWLRLMSGPATERDVQELFRRLEAEENPGSGWLDLRLQFRAWAREQGFKL